MVNLEEQKQNLKIINDFLNGESIFAYRYFGAHHVKQFGEEFVAFRCWAPNAKLVSVVGDFNSWQGDANIMNKLHDKGIWECFIRDVKQFDLYKYEITSDVGRVF